MGFFRGIRAGWRLAMLCWTFAGGWRTTFRNMREELRDMREDFRNRFRRD